MLLLCLPASQLCCKVFTACVKVVPCSSSRGMGEAFGEVFSIAAGLLCGFLQEAVPHLQSGIGRPWKEKIKTPKPEPLPGWAISFIYTNTLPHCSFCFPGACSFFFLLSSSQNIVGP